MSIKVARDAEGNPLVAMFGGHEPPDYATNPEVYRRPQAFAQAADEMTQAGRERDQRRGHQGVARGLERIGRHASVFGGNDEKPAPKKPPLNPTTRPRQVRPAQTAEPIRDDPEARAAGLVTRELDIAKIYSRWNSTPTPGRFAPAPDSGDQE